MLKYLVFVGMIIFFLGTLSYIKGIIKGKVKPNGVTWFIWSAAPIIASVAAFTDGVGLATLPVFVAGSFPLMVFTISLFKKGAFFKLARFDILCGVLSILALVVWYITKNPATAIAISILSDLLATLPTVIKSWKYPETEEVYVHLSSSINAATSFAAIETWNFSSVAFPVYIIIITLIICAFIERHRLFKPRQKK